MTLKIELWSQEHDDGEILDNVSKLDILDQFVTVHYVVDCENVCRTFDMEDIIKITLIRI